jgi:hypothetical protein
MLTLININLKSVISNVSVAKLALLLHTGEVQGFKLGPESNYLHIFLIFFG